MKKILFILLPLTLIILAQCSRGAQFQKLYTITEKNCQKIDSLSVVADNNTKLIADIKDSHSQSIKSMEDKLVAIEIIQSKMSMLESKLNNINSKVSSQQEILNDLQAESKPTSSEQKEISFEKLYQEARNSYLDKEFQKSITKFTEFIKKFPDNTLAANAQYWIGECYYSLEQFETAIFHFDKVVINYPESEKVVDAKLKIAFCLSDMGEYEGALTQLREIKKHFPDYERMNIVRDKIMQLENR